MLKAEGVELAVINEELILKCIAEERRSDTREESYGETLVKTVVDPTEISAVPSLSLSFKNIFKIDNLVGLTALHTLKLDNNLIREVENLSHLVNLTWLDLSFNNISTISGLESLTKLTDLSLFNNNISTLEGLDTLKALQVFSVGNNNIRSTDTLMYLRDFPKLRVVNLEGNPVCDDPEYRTFVLAHLKHLKYLDYALVDEADVRAAKETYQDLILELEEKEQIEEAAAERERVKEEHMALLRSANMDIVETLFQQLFSEDTEMPRLKHLMGIDRLIEKFNEGFTTLTAEFKKVGLASHEEKDNEVKEFNVALDDARTRSQTDGVRLAEAFAHKKKTVFRGMTGTDDVDIASLQALLADNTELRDALMEIEMELFEQTMEVIHEFESSFGNIKTTIRDQQSSYFRAVEELENEFSAELTDLAQDLFERAEAGEFDDDETVTEEARSLLAEKDTLLNAVQSSHDTHVSKILAKDDEMRDRELKQFDEILNGIKEAEWERNRQRMTEIHDLLKQNKVEVEEMLAEVTGLDDD
eukprot:PLAT4206.1.p1 GENE.PLAT4206.1~~PLAT4206.1.p1  ORF type:complete len:531 (-),score=294.20 PLAT4206.1:136-1728(-)